MLKKFISAVLSVSLVLTAGAYAFADVNPEGKVQADNDAVMALNQKEKPGKVINLKVYKNGYNSLRLSWDAADGADYYQVYRSRTGKKGSFLLKRTTTSTKYSNIGITCGNTYYYKVRAVNKNGKGTFSEVKSNTVKPSTVKITKVRPIKNRTNRVHWNKVSGASGYQVYIRRADQSNWRWEKTLSKDSTYYTDIYEFDYIDRDWRKDEANYDWYYKVRAFRNVNGKRVYGYFSESKKWVPDWTVDEICKELAEYGESLEWVMHEENPEYIHGLGMENTIPMKDGTTYHMTHIIGCDSITYDPVYTNPANGPTEIPEHYEPFTPENSSYYVGWPIYINRYMTKDYVMNDLKESLYEDLRSTYKANPLYWDTTWNDYSGVDSFTIYSKKIPNGYEIWGLW